MFALVFELPDVYIDRCEKDGRIDAGGHNHEERVVPRSRPLATGKFVNPFDDSLLKGVHFESEKLSQDGRVLVVYLTGVRVSASTSLKKSRMIKKGEK